MKNRLPSSLLPLLGTAVFAQNFEIPQNPEERTQFKPESGLKKMLKAGNDSAFSVLISETIADFYRPAKDYKTALNFLEDIKEPADSEAFLMFKILISGGYGKKAKLKDAREIYEKSAFKNKILLYSDKNDLPMNRFF